MNVINLKEFRKQPVNQGGNRQLKEFDEYYSYSFIDEKMDYEDFQTDTIKNENIFVSYLQYRGKIVVASLLFPKSFGFQEAVEWLNHHVHCEKSIK